MGGRRRGTGGSAGTLRAIASSAIAAATAAPASTAPIGADFACPFRAFRLALSWSGRAISKVADGSGGLAVHRFARAFGEVAGVGELAGSGGRGSDGVAREGRDVIGTAIGARWRERRGRVAGIGRRKVRRQGGALLQGFGAEGSGETGESAGLGGTLRALAAALALAGALAVARALLTTGGLAVAAALGLRRALVGVVELVAVGGRARRTGSLALALIGRGRRTGGAGTHRGLAGDRGQRRRAAGPARAGSESVAITIAVAAATAATATSASFAAFFLATPLASVAGRTTVGTANGSVRTVSEFLGAIGEAGALDRRRAIAWA